MVTAAPGLTRRERRLARVRFRTHAHRFLVRSMSLAVVLVAIAVPVVVAARVLTVPTVAAQVAPPDVPLDPTSTARYEAFRSNDTQTAPVILSYHNVAPEQQISARDVYTVTPEELAAQMSMLRNAGFTAISSKDLDDYIRGKPLPPRSVYITFDDAPKGVWIYADPVLAEYGMRATVFTITGFVGKHQPYYTTWDELTRLHDTGRWDIEAHTHIGHGRIQVDADGRTNPFLVNLAWLPGRHRLETVEEWDHRVTRDLLESKQEIEEHGFPTPIFFAYPFSAVTFPTNDARIPALLQARTREIFPMSVVNAENAGLVTRRDIANRLLPRVEVFHSTTVDGLFDRVAMWDPIQVAKLRPFSETDRWIDDHGHTLPAASFGDDTLTLTPDAGGHAGAFFAPGRLASWAEYRTSVRIDGLGPAGSGTGAALHVLAGSDSEYEIAISNSWLKVLRGRTSDQKLLADHSIPGNSGHDIVVTAEGGTVTIAVDGTVVLTDSEDHPELGLPSGGIGVSMTRTDPNGPDPAFRAIRIEPVVATTPPPAPPKAATPVATP